MRATVSSKTTFRHHFARSRVVSQTMVNPTGEPISGLWLPTYLKALHYGPDTVKKNLLSCLPSERSRAFIVTGNSLATKTNLIKQVEELLKGTSYPIPPFFISKRLTGYRPSC